MRQAPLFPTNFKDWQRDIFPLNGRTVCVARRNGTTLQFIYDGERWTVTKMRGGRILDQQTLKNIPQPIKRSIMARN